MNNQFSFARVGLLLRLDFKAYGKEFVLAMSAIPFVWFTLMWLTRFDNTSEMSEICFVLNGFLALLTFCGHAARKMFREKHSFMITPASNEEKYVSFLAEGFIYLLISQLGFWLGSYLAKHFWPTVHVASLEALFYHMEINIALTLLFAVALYLVVAMSVRKLWFLVAIAVPNVYVLLHIIILALLAFSFSDFEGVMIEGQIGRNETFSMIRGSEYISQTVKLIAELYAPVMAVSSLILFYVSYLKIKEQELK